MSVISKSLKRAVMKLFFITTINGYTHVGTF